MPEYKCDKCNTIFQKKWNYEYHLNRKNPCIISINKEKETDEKRDVEKIKCEYCNKTYSSISNLNKHLKLCKLKNKDENMEEIKKDIEEIEIKKEQNDIIEIKMEILDINENKEEIIEDNIEINKDDDKTKIEKMLNEITELKNLLYESIKSKNQLETQIQNHLLNQTHQQVNNIFLTQVNQNITINNYGMEHLEFLDKQFYIELIKTPYDSVPKLIKEIHFNEQIPRNMNIMLPNQNLPFIYLYQNGRWAVANKAVVLNDIMNKNFERVDDFFESYKELFETNLIEQYMNYTSEYEYGEVGTNIQKNVEEVLEKGSKNIIEKILNKNLLTNQHKENFLNNLIQKTNNDINYSKHNFPKIENFIPDSSFTSSNKNINQLHNIK